ncbi:MAG: FAD-dependent oxidoreductase [Calditrichaeota bacterium]|nr:MAG: FAD-dependent oxidoreductase [Calditrichota bacterium]
MTGYAVVVDAQRLFARDKEPTKNEKSPGVEGNLSASFAAADEKLHRQSLHCDVLVAGGGMAGVCAALAAARHGAKTLLIQDRSRLGGNGSSEIKMHIVGADNHGARPGWREGGILEELRLDNAVRNPQQSWEVWDLLLYDKCISEPSLDILLDTIVCAAQVDNHHIHSITARCDKAETLYTVEAKIFIDCTGDSRLALEAGALFRLGRESQSEFGEALAPEQADKRTQGASILFTAKEYDRPMPFTPPAWARKLTKSDFIHRPIDNSWEYGYWWIELGGMGDVIRDNEKLRFELLAVVLGIWDYIKNSGSYPAAANWALETIGMIPGRRESRRIMGEHMLTQGDLEGHWKSFPDGVAFGGWNMDDHPPQGFDNPDIKPFNSVPLSEPYNIPLRSLYSKTIDNLMMAGRNISCSHVAFSSTRVMGTCSAVGQAAGTAAFLCATRDLLPVDLYRNQALLNELQQNLLRDDQGIRNLRNQDPLDLARRARVIAADFLPGAMPDHVINGFIRDEPGEWANRWAAPMSQEGVWIELAWDTPISLSVIQITFDTGFERELTFSSSNWVKSRIVHGPQPETVKSYRLSAFGTDGRERLLAEEQDNYQRLRRHRVTAADVARLRLSIHATHGAAEARIFEIRCYA